MTRPKRPRWFRKGDSVRAIFGESAAGPGWANRPLWVIVCDENRKLREECLQPEEQTAAMHYLYRVSEAANVAMRAAFDELVRSR